MIVSAAIYIAIMTFPTIANKTARIAIMTSSCRLPSSLLAAGMPLEFRLTLDFLPTDYVEDLRWSICHLTLYRRAGVGDGRLPGRWWLPIRCGRKFFGTPQIPTDCQGCGCTRPHISEKKHFGVTSNMTCSMVPHVGRRQLQLIMQLLNYSTVLTRRAQMRRTGDHGLPMLYANVN